MASGPSGFGLPDRRWFDQLEAEIGMRFGLDVRIAPEDPNEWLMTID